MKLTEFQKGTIFGLLLGAAACGFAFPWTQDKPAPAKGQAEPAHVGAESNKPEAFRQTALSDPTAFFTLCLVLVGGVQAGLFVHQFKLIGIGLRDSEKAAEAAEKAANAAEQQAMLAQQSLIASQRAWVIVEAEISDGGLMFDGLGVEINIALRLKNIGNTIALNITPHAQVFPGGKHGPSIQGWRDFIERCKRHGLHYGFYLVPGDTMPNDIDPRRFRMPVSAQTIRYDWVRDWMQESVVTLCVGGCITYTFASDPGVAHHTGFFMHVLRKDRQPITPALRAVPAVDLELVRDAGSNFVSID